MPGAPFKPGFGLSGAVRQMRIISPRLVRVFLLSTRTRFQPVRHSPSPIAENCSTPSLPAFHTTRALPDCDDYTSASPRIAAGFGH